MKIFTTSLLLAGLLATTITLHAQSKQKHMKLSSNQTAPTFTITDVTGKTINLAEYKGKKVLLSFYRNVGCPVCNFRFHELQMQSEYFKAKDLVVIAVYESTAENMKQYLEGESFYAQMIPNSDEQLYKLYALDKSMGKMMKGMFHGAMGKLKAGKAQFRKKIKQDGNASRIGADFLIDESGRIKTAYYGKYLGDHLPLADIKAFLN
jgi:thioredoxin-dependent peroxiredoxin